MTEIMPVPRNLILLSYQQGAFSPGFLACYNLVTRFAGNNEIKCIDFTRGTEDYKYKLNGTEKHLCNFTFNI